MKKYALIGKKVDYSYSKIIHEYLGELKKIELEYELISTDNIKNINIAKYDGLNITIPYKSEILDYVSAMTSEVEHMGNANTIFQDKAYNTDISGLHYALNELIGDLNKVKRVVVLGNSNTAKMISYLFKDSKVIIVSRNPVDKQVSYDELDEFYGDLIINTTPLTMNNLNKSPITSEHLKKFKYVYDLNYNPSHNLFLKDATELNIPNDNGLLMLIMQAIYAFEIWTEQKVSISEINQVIDYVKSIVHPKKAIIGMPYSGKTTLGKSLQKEGFRVIDLDDEIKKVYGDIAEYIEFNGIDKFRKIENEILGKIVELDYEYLICGGGIVENINNYQLLNNHQILYLEKNLDTLQKQMEKSILENGDKRPLTADFVSLKKRLGEREIKYKIWAKDSIII